MIAFVDTSVLVRRYLDEAGSDRVRALFRGHRETAVSRLTFIELCAAVARSCHFGVISISQRDAILSRLPTDLGESTVVELKRTLLDHAAELVRLHPLRAADAIQLASCLSIRAQGSAVELLSADAELLAAARAEGLKTVAL